jgi:hypothetical protein
MSGLIEHPEYKCRQCQRWKQVASKIDGCCITLDMETGAEFFCAHFQQKGPFRWFYDSEADEYVFLFVPEESEDCVLRIRRDNDASDMPALTDWLNRLWVGGGSE